MIKPPKVKFSDAEPLQEYYGDEDGNLYSIARLLDSTAELPVFDCPLAALNLSFETWQGCNMLALAWHVKRCNDADLDKPILLDWNGNIADGRHRIIKALSLGKRTIKARRMTWRPEPCSVEEE
ncbi:hypothetical protein QP097_07540 [Oligella urethralis]|uniref:hypothetical protein n=1 Tax=Oligella urethralis TaxID=90245 RepID=UPI00242EA7F0|nr:hypothetical protein [Oligella urethralis]MDK6203311.1 hypothetical protein [Oligella urethralis]